MTTKNTLWKFRNKGKRGEIFGPAVELRAAGIILLHNHPSGDVSPNKQDVEVVNKILEAGKIMGVNVIDFIVVSENDTHSFFTEILGAY